MNLKSQLVSLIIALFAITGCVPTEPAAQDTIPITITRSRPTPTPTQDTAPLAITRVEPTVAPTPTATLDPAAPTIIETLTADGRFTIFLSLLDLAGLTPLLSGPGPFTLFVPPDEALQKLPAGAIEKLQTDSQLRVEFLQRHISLERLTRTQFADNDISCDWVALTTTLNGEDLRYGLDQYGRSAIHLTYIRHATGMDTHNIVLEQTDLHVNSSVTNGVIHVLRAPILPSDSPWYQASITELRRQLSALAWRTVTPLIVRESDGYCIPEDLIGKLSSDGGDYTLFLPTDAAWAAAENEIGFQLLDNFTATNLVHYHIVEELISSTEITSTRILPTLYGAAISISPAEAGKLNINGEDVQILNEIPVTEGVIYIIDRLFIPPDMNMVYRPPTIREALQADPEFQTVLFMWDWAEEHLNSIMEQPGPFIIFVVTDSALYSLSEARQNIILRPDSQYPPYLIVTGETNLQPGTSLATTTDVTLEVTLNGSEITIGSDEIGRATIIHTIQTINGVIYVLDQPLFPR